MPASLRQLCRLLTVAIVLHVPNLARAAEPRKVAFLVGVSKYDKAGLNNLEYAEEDMRELAGELKKAGFTVTLMLGGEKGDLRATRDNLHIRLEEEFLDRQAKKLDKRDVVLIGLSGHGLQIQVPKNGKLVEDSFFCPVDALKTDPGTMLSIGDLMENLAANSGAENNLLVIDACRDNPAKGSKALDGSNVTQLPPNLAVLFSSSAGTRSYESDKLKHGIFAYYLLEGLRGGAEDKDDEVTWDALVGYVKKHVDRAAPNLVGNPQRPNGISNLQGAPPVLAASSTSLRRPPAEPLRNEISHLADAIASSLPQTAKELAIGDFTGTKSSTFSPAIVQALSAEFPRLGVKVKVDSAVRLKGEYCVLLRDAPGSGEPQSGRKRQAVSLRIFAWLVDKSGNPVGSLQAEGVPKVQLEGGKLYVDILEESTVMAAVGANVVIPADSTPRERVNRVFETVESAGASDVTPRIEEQTRVFAGPGSPYGVEIYAARLPPDNSQDRILSLVRPRVASVQDQLPFVSLQRDEVYAIKLINNSKYDAAIRLTIDGLSTFEFSEVRHTEGAQAGRPRYSVWIVPPGESRTVPGWHKTNSKADAFLVTDYARSAAALRGKTTDLGVITAVFSAAWSMDEKGQPLNMPADEPPKKKGTVNATGFGPPIKTQIQEVQRTIGVPRASVTVRYTRRQE